MEKISNLDDCIKRIREARAAPTPSALSIAFMVKSAMPDFLTS